jgi:hypothetical protein
MSDFNKLDLYAKLTLGQERMSQEKLAQRRRAMGVVDSIPLAALAASPAAPQADTWEHAKFVQRVLGSDHPTDQDREDSLARVKEFRQQVWESGRIAELEAERITAAGLYVTVLEELAALKNQGPVTWGVDWGRHGDLTCVSIVKKHPNGQIEVVATEYEPEAGAQEKPE